MLRIINSNKLNEKAAISFFPCDVNRVERLSYLKVRSHLTTTTLFFCRQVGTVPLVTMQPISFCHQKMGAASIPDGKNMHRCRQVRTDP